MQLDIAKQSPNNLDSTTDKYSLSLVQNLESRKWLLSNIQIDYWNNLQCQRYSVTKQSCNANICDIW